MSYQLEKSDSATVLYSEIAEMIEQGRRAISVHANNTAIITFWRVGKRINEDILHNKRAEYGKQIVSTLSTQLSWSHFVELLPLKSLEARLYYAYDAFERCFGVRELRQAIARRDPRKSCAQKFVD